MAAAVMRILMHDNALTERGTTNALETYARGLSGLDHQVEVAFDATNPQNVDGVIRRLDSQFPLIPYSQFEEISRRQDQYDVAYFIKSGHRDGRYFSETPSLVHAVFQDFEPHGSSYIYVSEWLAAKMKRVRWKPRHIAATRRAEKEGCLNARKFEFVPHAVDVAIANRDQRHALGISEKSFVILRYGGKGTFDLPWVHNEIVDFVSTHDDAVALMVNTDRFCDHPRVQFLPAFTSAEGRDQLLASCDVFLHAQHFGETFGLALVETMQAERPILSWSGGYNGNYVELLRGTGSLFENREELRQKLEEMRAGNDVVDVPLAAQRADRFRSIHVLPELIRQFDAIRA